MVIIHEHETCIAAVKEVHEKYGGQVPADPKEISALKGVGPYTAGAILSIAYGIPEPAVDGNVMRVLSRILLIRDDIAKPLQEKYLKMQSGNSFHMKILPILIKH